MGKGTVFSFSIPLSVIPNDVIMPLAVQRDHVTGLEEGQQCYRLLIAEDQPENRLLLRQTLEPLEFEIREAVNGQDAVAQCSAWHPDLVFMDIRMPIMNGTEATRRIKASDDGPNIKIVAVTAHAFEEERKEILESGCDDFIRKPFLEHEIFEALSKHLGVRFRFDKARCPVEGETNTLQASDLQNLPMEIINELLNAAELLDRSFCLEVVNRIKDFDNKCADLLLNMVDKYQFEELIDLLDTVVGRRPVEYH